MIRWAQNYCSRWGSNSQPPHLILCYKYGALTDCATGADNSQNIGVNLIPHPLKASNQPNMPSSIAIHRMWKMWLYFNYQSCFHKTKKKLEEMPDERQFEFSEMYIFGKFDTFTRRLKKIIEMFNTIEMYSHLQDSKIEGRLPSLIVKLLSLSLLCGNATCTWYWQWYHYVKC